MKNRFTKTLHYAACLLLFLCIGISDTFGQNPTVLSAPTWNVDPQNKTVSCAENYQLLYNEWKASAGGATVNSDCDEVFISSDNPDFTEACGNTGSVIVTFTATNPCDGTTSTRAAIFAIVDTIAPIWNTSPTDLSVDCNTGNLTATINNWLENNGTATDDCGAVSIIHNYSDLPTVCDTTIVDFTAVDACGNTSVQTAKLILTDSNSPTWTIQPTPLRIICSPNSDTDAIIDNWLTSRGNGVASDPCDDNLTYTNNFSALTGVCAGAITEVIFTATDACGNSTDNLSSIVMVDQGNPVWTRTPDILVLECDGTDNPSGSITTWLANHGEVDAIDACGEITYTHDYTATNITCGMTGVTPIVFTATDECGNSATVTTAINIVDTTSPVWTRLPQDTSVNCGDDIASLYNAWRNNNGGGIASDNCGDITVTYDNPAFADSCGASSSVLVTFTATDECGGNTVTSIAVFTVTDNIAPVWVSNPTALALDCNTTGNIYTAVNEWLSNNGNGTIVETCGDFEVSNNFDEVIAPCANGGVTTVQFTATDGCGNEAIRTAQLSIVDNIAPTWTTVPSDLNLICRINSAIDLDIIDWLENNGLGEATDQCGTVSISHDYDGLDGDCSTNNETLVTFTATDICGNQTPITAKITVTDTTAPTLTEIAESVIRECDDRLNAVSFEQWVDFVAGAVAADFCSQIDPEDWSHEIIDEQYFCGNTFSKTVRFTVVDDCGNATSTTATYTAKDDTTPELEEIAQGKTIFCGTGGEQDTLTNWIDNKGGAIAVDKCSQVTWIGFQFDDTESGFGDTISFGDYNNYPQIDRSICNYRVSLKWIAVDECGNESYGYASFLLLDIELPRFVAPFESLVVECSEIPEAIPPQVVDNCDDDLEMLVHDSIVNLSCATEYTLLRTWTAIDNCGNSTSQVQTIAVVDSKAPTFNTTVTNLTVSCDAIPNVEEVEAIDDCGGIPIVDFEETRLDGNCEASYVLNRVWTATDSCGNVSYLNQRIEVVDNTPPVFSGPATIVLSCDQSTDPDSTGLLGLVTDNCDASPTASSYDVIQYGDCSNSYTIERNWVSIDACGNISEPFVQTIIVKDTISPIVITAPISDTIICARSTANELFENWVNNHAGAIIEDNCTIDQNLTWHAWVPGSYNLDNLDAFPGEPVGDLDAAVCRGNRDSYRQESVDFVVIDECGNLVVSNAHFVVIDTIAPVFSACPDNISVALNENTCESEVEMIIPFISDECGSGEIEFTYSINGGEPIEHSSSGVIRRTFASGEYRLTYYATDCVGNIDSCSFAVSIIDSVAPMIVCPSNIQMTLAAGQSCTDGVDAGLQAPQATDNCESTNLMFKVYTTGATSIDTMVVMNLDAPSILFEVGETEVFYIVEDNSGNRASCSFMVEIIDTIPPVANCQTAIFYVAPSGENYNIDPQTTIDNGSTDNCGIVSYRAVPSSFNCEQVGELFPITMMVEDAFGNIDSCTTTIEIANMPITPTYVTSVCGSDTLNLFLNDEFLDEGVYTYSWTGPNDFTSNLRNPVIAGVNTSYSGTYEVSVTGNTGCEITANINVTIGESIATPEITASRTDICEGESIVLTTNFTTLGAIYEWYVSDTLFTTTVDPTLNTADYLIEGLGANTDIYLVIRTGECASPASETITVTVDEIPTVSLVEDTIALCEGAFINLEVGSTLRGVNYQWTGPNNYTSTEQNPLDFIATTDAAGHYYVIAINGNCSSVPDSVYVDVITKPLLPVLDIDDPEICVGESLVLRVDGSDDYTYTWFLPNDSVNTDTSTLILENVDMTAIGHYSVRVSDRGCISDVSITDSLTVHPLPEVNAYNEGPSCQGISNDYVQLFVNTTPGAVYYWLGPNGFSSIDQYAQADTTGTYIVNVTTAFGCSQQDTTEVLYSEAPVILALNHDASDCVNGIDDITLSAQLTQTDDSYQYEWTGPNLLSTNNEVLIPSASAAINGSYTLVVTNGDGCESLPVTTVIDVKDAPLTPNVYGDLSICENGDLILNTDTLIGNGVVYYWQTPNGVDTTFIPAISVEDISNDEAGDYSVIVENNGCLSDTSAISTVVMVALPETPVITAETSVCEGENLELSIPEISGATYTWVGPNNFQALDIHNPVLLNVSSEDIGSYSVKVEVNGCSSDWAAPINLEVHPRPTAPIIMGDEVICIGQSGNVLNLSIDPSSAIPGAIYHWYDGTSNQLLGSPSTGLGFSMTDFTDYTDGSYSFYATTTVNGCVSPNSIPFTVRMHIIPDQIADAGVDKNICIDQALVMDAGAALVGAGTWTQIEGPYTTITNPSLPNTTINGLSPDSTYKFLWTLSNGTCGNYSSDEVTIQVFNNTEVANAGEDNIICGADGLSLNAVAVSESGNIGTWTQEVGSGHEVGISSINSPNTLIQEASPNATYTFLWSISNPGCGVISSDEVNIEVLPAPAPIDAGDDLLLCGNGTLSLNADEIPVDATASWSTDSDAIILFPNDRNSVVTGLETGVYTFLWTVDLGVCGIKEDSVVITYAGAPVANPDSASTNFGTPIDMDLRANDLVSSDLVLTIVEEPANGDVLILSNGVVTYTPNSTFFGEDMFVYSICSQTCPLECGEATATIFVEEGSCVVPTIFTPNNDGTNDTFIIPCLGNGEYPDNLVTVFNQWGDEVLSVRNYENDWNGQYKGKDLPVGTYYYIIDLNNGNKPLSGFLVLER